MNRNSLVTYGDPTNYNWTLYPFQLYATSNKPKNKSTLNNNDQSSKNISG